MTTNPFCLMAFSGMLTMGTASAATVFTSRAAFLSTVMGGTYTESFTGSTPPTYLLGALGYTVSTGTGTVGKIYNSGSFIGTIDQTTFTLTFHTGNITAVGGNFYVTDIADVFVPTAITITLSDGTSDTFTPASTGEFRGYISTGVLTSLTMSGTTAGFITRWTISLWPACRSRAVLAC